jgi:DNA replication protein DnaC
MLMEPTIEKLNAMKLTGMTEALRLQQASSQHAKLSFDERFGLLVDAEWEAREHKRQKTRLHAAKMRVPASLEDIDYAHPRGLDRQAVLGLANCGFITGRQNVVLTGPTGTGKTYITCAFVEQACRRGHRALYVRMPRLLQDIAVARGDGSYGRLLDRLVKVELLAIDDWLLSPLRDAERRDLVEVIEDRHERGSTLVASQLLTKDWHASIGDPNLADAICDRVISKAHRIELKGPSLRPLPPKGRPAKKAA